MPPTKSQKKPVRPHDAVVVTGDVVLDCHLYGPQTNTRTFSAPGTAYQQRLGGAALTHDLLRDAFAAAVRDWKKRKEDWEKENEALQKEGKDAKEWPSDIPKVIPELDIHLGINTAALETTLPPHLRSYGVWTDHASKKNGGPNARVWRVERDFGYGPFDSEPETPKFEGFKATTGVPTAPTLTVIDEGALLFRSDASKDAWPQRLKARSRGHFLLKMSSPLCRGEFWEALEPVMDRLIVIVSASDLRREDIQISRRLSWEQCVNDTLDALQRDETGSDLARAAHVIVNFQSAGALWVRRTRNGHVARLIFDPARLEGDYGLDFEGNVYGRQSCLTVGVAYQLLAHHAGWNTSAAAKDRKSPFADAETMGRAIEAGIRSGITARRKLLELGHGIVGKKKEKPKKGEEPPQEVLGFPLADLSNVLFTVPAGFQSADVPAPDERKRGPWTFLEGAETGAPSPGSGPIPLVGLAKLAAVYGTGALSHVPSLRMGKVFTVDRAEIESLRMLEGLIRDYENVKVQKKPLSIGVFGPPGAGKSFGVRALAEGVLGEGVPFLEFNLSQFKDPDELVGAFHRVRDAVLKGATPVAFWDEFDSQNYKWLQYLLAPMQDGAFQEREITHPIGKCIFVFAGGTSPTIDMFGVPKPTPPTRAQLRALSPSDRAAAPGRFDQEMERYRDFRMLKGPDFVSRLHGFLNVLGPNAKTGDPSDISWPVRRARLLRTLLGLRDSESLDIDPGLLHALLSVRTLEHGARSFEKIIGPLATGRDKGRVQRASLPPDPVLARETDAKGLRQLMQRRNALRSEIDIETLAAGVHFHYLAAGKRSEIEARVKKEPYRAWTMHPVVKKPYEDLPEDTKESNRGAARRIPGHLGLIDFEVVRQTARGSGSWKVVLAAAIARYRDPLARAEHLGWCAERVANGWTYNARRDDAQKHHHLLVSWAELSPADQNKDRRAVEAIPDILDVAGYKSVPANTGR